MRKQSFFSSLIAFLAIFVMYSCTNESVEEQSGMENVEEVQMQELI